MVDEKPYIVSLETPQVGDEVIITVGGLYPSFIKIESDIIYDLVVNKKPKLTQTFKIFMKPEMIKMSKEQIEKILENQGFMECFFEDGIYKFSL